MQGGEPLVIVDYAHLVTLVMACLSHCLGQGRGDNCVFF
jgi:hypothetical protein